MIYSLLFDNIQALVYAGPGALYAAHLVLPLLLILAVHLPSIPPLLAFTTLLWFHPLHLLGKERHVVDVSENDIYIKKIFYK